MSSITDISTLIADEFTMTDMMELMIVGAHRMNIKIFLFDILTLILYNSIRKEKFFPPISVFVLSEHQIMENHCQPRQSRYP